MLYIIDSIKLGRRWKLKNNLYSVNILYMLNYFANSDLNDYQRATALLLTASMHVVRPIVKNI